MKASFLKYSLIISSVAVIFSSCKKDGWPCKNGNGPIQTEVRNVTGFTSIDDQTEAEVYISQGTDFEVRVEAQENLLEEIRTELKGGELQIYSEHCINHHDPIKVFITLPSLSGIKVSGSGYVATTGQINAGSIFLTVSGSGYLQVQDSIFATNVDMTVSGSGKIDFIGESHTASAVISGSGNVVVMGQGIPDDVNGGGSTFDLTISGSGSIQAYGYPVDTCHFTISGSGNAQVSVSEYLEGTISGSGSLMYKGDPALSVTIGGSGAIVHVD